MATTSNVFIAAAALCISVMTSGACAQTYPAKPIHLIVPFTPGGTTDILARALGQKWTEAWGKQIIVENRPGAGGSVAAEAVARSPADGYTIMVGHIGTLAVNPSLYPKLGYDPLKSFAPITLIATVPSVLVVHPGIPANSVAELIAYVKANPGKLNYSTGGNGSAAHLAMEYFKLRTGTNIVHIPYKGTAPAVTDLLGGQVAMSMTGAPALMPHVQAGRLKALGVTSLKRIPALPQIPTISEAGVAGFEATQWYGIVAPAGTPPEIIRMLNAETVKIMATTDMEERLASDGAIGTTDTPEEFAAHIKAEIARWGEVVRNARMKAE